MLPLLCSKLCDPGSDSIVLKTAVEKCQSLAPCLKCRMRLHCIYRLQEDCIQHLANGASRVLVDGQNYAALDAPTAETALSDGHTVVSATNLPAECQPFGGDGVCVWASTVGGRLGKHVRRFLASEWGGSDGQVWTFHCRRP